MSSEQDSDILIPSYIQTLDNIVDTLHLDFMKLINPENGEIEENKTMIDMEKFIKNLIKMIIYKNNIETSEDKDSIKLYSDNIEINFETGSEYIIYKLYNYDLKLLSKWENEENEENEENIDNLLLSRICDFVMKELENDETKYSKTELNNIYDIINELIECKSTIIIPEKDEHAELLLRNIDTIENELTLDDYNLYLNIMTFIDEENEQDVIDELCYILDDNKEVFTKLENYIDVLLKHKEYYNETPEIIDNLRYARKLFNDAFKNCENILKLT
tara:strand:- start:1147 stop:1971 length:825 start_codon:yes stop_codon:yes gene_type:complete